MRVVVVLVWSLCVAAPAWATTYYVGTSGSDANSCATAQSSTAGNRKLTIRAGIACAGTWASPGSGAGDTVIVGNGTYAEEIFWNDWPTGTVGNPFTLMAETRGTCGDTFGGCNVTLLPTTGVCNTLPCYNMEIGDAGIDLYIVIDGLKLDGSNLCCENAAGIGGGHSLRPYGNRFTAQYLEIKDPMSSPVSSSASDSTFTHIAINGCSRDQAYKSGTGHNVIYHGGSRALYDYVTVAGSNCLHNEITFFNGGGGGPASEDNIFDHCLTNGIGVGIWSGARNIVRNCLIMNNTSAFQEQGNGIVIADACASCQALNNTVYNNVANCIYINTNGNFNVVVRNNICRANGTNAVVNDMAGGGGAVISENLTTDPSFVSPTTDASFKDRTATNFQLQATSAAKDAGANLSASGVTDDLAGRNRLKKPLYDIGAYMFIKPHTSYPTTPGIP